MNSPTRTSMSVLDSTQREKLESSIQGFKAWLCKLKKLTPEVAAKYSTFVFPRPDAHDWLMEVKGSAVHFNTYILSDCSFDYLRLVIIHECYHLFVQGLPNKSDVKRLRDDFGWNFMTLLDIEADYWAAMYFKEVERVSLVDMFSLYYEGSRIFGDPDIRLPKLERFIGSILSVANSYFSKPTGREMAKNNELYLATIGNIPTDETIHILLCRRNNFCLGELKMGYSDFVTLKKCYTWSEKQSRAEYVETLITLTSKALGISIPMAIWSQLNKLRMTAQSTPRLFPVASRR